MAVLIFKVADVGLPDLAHLAGLAAAEGHSFVARTIADWDSGANRFDAPGEGLFVAIDDEEVVGQCGLNIDPYIDDPTVGRLRHLYVIPSLRRHGFGRDLVGACLDLAIGRFDQVRLRTFDAEARRFYEAIGFSETDEPDATHFIDLGV